MIGEIKDYDWCYDQCYDRWTKLFQSTSKNNLRTGYNVRKIATGQGDNYTTSSLLDYNCFDKYYKMITIELSKQLTLNADPKATQQISFTGNLARDGNENTTILFIIEEAKETAFRFFTSNCKSFVNLFCFNIKSI